jgi:hypothetical protein
LKNAYANVIRRKGQEREKKFGETQQEAAMQIQDLRRKTGENRLLIWPLRVWTSHGGDSFAVSHHAELARVRRIGDRLTIAVKYDNREHTGILEWDPPPAVEAVEAVLRAHLGNEIGTLGDLKVD